MLSNIIVICSLFFHVSLGCGSISINGVPQSPLHVCAGIKLSGLSTMYYQFICDSTKTGILMSVHRDNMCVTETMFEYPYDLGSSMDVNCEHKYDCSYALYRWYNDSTAQCQHSTATPFIEIPLIVGHCGYDYTIQASMKYTCDENTIYTNTDLGDTQGLCQDTIEAPYISAGCDETTGQYNDVVGCEINPILSSESTPDDGPSTGVIVGVVIGIIVLLAAAILGVVYYKKKNPSKPETDGYEQVKIIDDKDKQEGPNSSHTQQTGHVGHVGQAPPPIQQIQPIQPIQQIQPIQPIQQIQQQPPPPPSYRPIPSETYQVAPKQGGYQTNAIQQEQQQQEQQIPDTQSMHRSQAPPVYQYQETQQTEPPPSPPPIPAPPKEENNKSVISGWLRQNAELSEMDANEYAVIFIENGFEDIKSLKDLTKDDLQEIGITKLGHKKAIIKAIQSDDCMLEPIY